MECLANILNRKFPLFNTVTPRHSLRDALYQMSCENLDYLVVQDGSDFVGILSEQDITHKLFAAGQPVDSLQVADIMNCRIPVGDTSDSIESAMQVLNQYDSRYLAVFDQLEFKGIVSEKDLLKQTLSHRNKLITQSEPEPRYNWAY